MPSAAKADKLNSTSRDPYLPVRTMGAFLATYRPAAAALAALLIGSLISPFDATAQDPTAAAQRADDELQLPDEPRKPGGDRRVVLKDPADQLVVARVLAEVGEK